MSEAGIDAVVRRALADAKFRDELLQEPDKACRRFDITPKELAAMKEALGLTYDAKLSERVSKSAAGRFAGFSGPMGIDGIVE